jgi:glycosyltransferase involved in cell wall biosynthesis
MIDQMNEKVLQKQPCIIFVANRSFALTSSRLILIQHFLSIGWKVVVATTIDDSIDLLVATEVIVEPISFNRGGFSPLSDIKSFWSLRKVYHLYHPTIIHHFHAKPILLGNLAALSVRKTKIINTVTGLGYAFVRGGPTRQLATVGYRLLLSRSDVTIFQNPDDLQLFLRQGWISKATCKLIVSSGVDTERFHPPMTIHHQGLRVLMVARLLWQKGVREFVEAAEIVKQKVATVRFQLAGELDAVHPDAVDEAWIQTAVNRGTVDFLGYLTNIDEQLRATDVFVLPSYYREGVPRVLLEAAASGVPVVTTDVPGCREAVVDGDTGRLVPSQDSQALAEAILEILKDSEQRKKMGLAGRRRIEAEFDIRMITEKQLAIYREIGVDLSIN